MTQKQKEIQKQKLFEFLTFCEKKIPYYKKLFQEHNFKPKDILEDMEKDSLIIPENKKFMKLLQQEVQNFIRPILLQN